MVYAMKNYILKHNQIQVSCGAGAWWTQLLASPWASMLAVHTAGSAEGGTFCIAGASAEGLSAPFFGGEKWRLSSHLAIQDYSVTWQVHT